MINELQEANKLLKSENLLLRQKINKKNKIIKKLISRNKFLESSLTPADTEEIQLTFYDFL